MYCDRSVLYLSILCLTALWSQSYVIICNNVYYVQVSNVLLPLLWSVEVDVDMIPVVTSTM